MEKHATRAAVALTLILLAGCDGDSSSPTSPDGVVAFTTVHQTQFSGIRTRRGEVISRGDVWRQTWEEINATLSPKPALPTVDFERNILLLAALGETGDACKRVAIESVEHRGGALRVSAKETRPPASCVCPPVTVQPVHVVSIPRAATGASFEFRSVTEGAGCN
jgi:hypothetical protein